MLFVFVLRSAMVGVLLLDCAAAVMMRDRLPVKLARKISNFATNDNVFCASMLRLLFIIDFSVFLRLSYHHGSFAVCRRRGVIGENPLARTARRCR